MHLRVNTVGSKQLFKSGLADICIRVYIRMVLPVKIGSSLSCRTEPKTA